MDLLPIKVGVIDKTQTELTVGPWLVQRQTKHSSIANEHQLQIARAARLANEARELCDIIDSLCKGSALCVCSADSADEVAGHAGAAGDTAAVHVGHSHARAHARQERLRLHVRRL